MQTTVVNAGPVSWTGALAWGRDRGLLTPTELGILREVAVGKTPSERQSSRAVEALNKLRLEGYTGELPSLHESASAGRWQAQ